MNESDITRKIMNIPGLTTGAYEVKVTKSHRIAFDRVLPHQEDALWRASHEGFRYKIRDEGFIDDQGRRMGSQKPFDFFVMRKYPAYIVIAFLPATHWYRIDIDTWMHAKKTHTMKSLTQEDVAEIGERFEFYTEEKKEKKIMECKDCGKETKQIVSFNGRNICYTCRREAYKLED